MSNAPDNAKKKNRQENKRYSTQANYQQGSSGQFVNYTFSEDDKKAFRQWYADISNAWQDADNVFREGYKISVSYTDKTASFQAYLRPGLPDLPNQGMLLSGYGRSSELAILSCVFKHLYVFETKWQLQAVPGSSEDFG